MAKVKRVLLSMVIALILIGNPVSTDIFSYTETVQAASSIKISKSKATLIKGQALQLKVTGTSQKAKWYTSKNSVASVTQTGKVVAKNKGAATITAKIGTKKVLCKITVETPKISKTSLSLNAGKKYTLKVTGTKQKIIWSSSNKSIATVSAAGVITAKKTGKAKITAKILGKNYICTVIVKSNDVLTVDKNSITIKNKGTIWIRSRSGGAIRYDLDKEGVIECKWGDWTGWENGIDSIPLYITSQTNGSVIITVTDKDSGKTVKINVTVRGLEPVEMYNKSSEGEKLGVYALYTLNDILNVPSSIIVHGIYTGISDQFAHPIQLTIVDYSAINGYGGYTREYYGCWRNVNGYFRSTRFDQNSIYECFHSEYSKLNSTKLQYIAKNVEFE